MYREYFPLLQYSDHFLKKETALKPVFYEASSK